MCYYIITERETNKTKTDGGKQNEKRSLYTWDVYGGL